MCSIDNESGLCDVRHGYIEKTLFNANCKKCKGKGNVVLQKRHVYCRNCFLIAMNHKFRSALGKHKLINASDNVMLIFNGNASSVSLLHMVNSALNCDSHKKLLFKPSILYIDEDVFAASDTVRKETLFKIKELIRKNSYNSYFIPLEAVLEEESSVHLKPFIDFDNSAEYVIDSTLKKKMKDVVGKLTVTTFKNDLLNLFRQDLYLKVADYIGCNKIFTIQNTNNLAVQLMTYIAEGRGLQVPVNNAICESRGSKIQIVRPLKELTSKEIAFYAVFNNLDFIHGFSRLHSINLTPSIHYLAEEFLCDLQDKFPATIYTICNTGDKLKMPSSDIIPKSICTLCKHACNMIDDVSSHAEVELLRNMSLDGDSSHNFEENDFKDCKAECKNEMEFDEICQLLDRNLKINQLCYGCRQICENMRK